MDRRVAAIVGQEPIVVKAFARMAARVLFTRAGRLLVTTGMEGVVRLWSTEDWRPAGEIRGHTNAVTSALLTSDESRLITTSTDRSTRVWSFPDGEPLHTLTGHKNTVTDAALSPNERQLATASYDGRILLYDFSSGALRSTLKGHARHVTSLSFSPDGALLASSGLGDEVLLWQMPEGVLALRLGGHTTVTGLAGWESEGAVVLTYDYAGALRRFRTDDGSLLSVTSLELPEISSLRKTPDGALLAAAAPHTLAFFDAHTLERLWIHCRLRSRASMALPGALTARCLRAAPQTVASASGGWIQISASRVVRHTCALSGHLTLKILTD